MSDEVQRESEHGRGDSRSATRDDRLRQVDAGLAEAVGKSRSRQERLSLGVEQVRERDVAAAGDVAAAQPRPRLLLPAVEAAGGAGIDHLLALARQVALHLRQI